MRRILHVIPGLTGGGAERQLTILARMQAQRGHQVHIALMRPDAPAELEDAGVQIHALSSAHNYDPQLLWRMRDIVRKIRPDLVQTWLTLPDVVGGAVSLIRGIPWILSERSEAAAYPPSLKHRARIALGKRSRAIIANSPGGARYWTAHGVPATRVSVVPNAVSIPPESLEPAAVPSHFQGRPLVMFAGRMSAEKNPLVLVDALAQALQSTNAMALLCGFGPLEDAVAARIRTHGMQERIVMAGHRPDVPALLRRAQVCVAVSTFEGNPNVVLEAMAAGCPLVVSDVPGYTQFLDDSCARIAPVHDAAAIAAAIVSVLNDPEAAASRALVARARLSNRTPDDFTDAHENVYDRIVYATT